jgi:hypothetical protein
MIPVIPPPAALSVVVFLARRGSLTSGASLTSRPRAAADVHDDQGSRTATARRRPTATFRWFRPFDLFAFEYFLVNLKELAFFISN